MDKDYFLQLLHALQLEQEDERKGIQELIEKSSPALRREKGFCWYPVKIVEDGYGLGSYPFLVVENPRPSRGNRFQSGNPVSLFSQADASFNERLNGIIGFMDDQRMKIVFHVDELPDWMHNGKIGVDILFDERSYREMVNGLNKVFQASEKDRLGKLRDIVLGINPPQYHDESVIFHEELNAIQNKAVQHLIQSEDIAVVHGPPGTGKTTTLVAAVQEWVKRGKKVLLSAPSNAATDHLLAQCIKTGLKGVRIGNLAKVEDDNEAFTLDALLSREREVKQIKELKKRAVEMRKMGAKYKRSFGKEEAEQRKLLFQESKNLMREARELEDYLTEKIIQESQVVAATLIGTAHPVLRDHRFDVLVIDECGQALEPACWVAIQKAQQFIVAGDPFQLPPTVKSREAEKAGLGITLLERLVKEARGVVMLEVQYRMHEKIMRFSNEQFYKGQLIAADEVKSRSWHIEQPVVQWIDTAGCGFEEKSGEDGESKMNPDEWNIISTHMERWGVQVDWKYAVISPYRAQVEYMQEMVGSNPQIRVDTIDSFQGQEADVVYISLVRSNERQELGFLRDYRRMNVALTRARRGLFIIGDSATLAGDTFFKALIDTIESQGGYCSAWEYL
jgi:ATP-dependent RNA/DNA helicase IGHMBP2